MKHLLRVFCIWGGLYIALVGGKRLITDDAIETILLDTLHNVLILSPGGGMWYVSALILLESIHHLLSREPESYGKKRTAMCVFFILTGMIPVVAVLPVFGGAFWKKLADIYNAIFLSTRNFLFFGIWYVFGVIFYHTRKYYTPVVSVAAFIITFLLRTVLAAVPILGFLSIIAYNYSIAACFYALGTCTQQWHTRRIQRMSTIIYFTHIAVIMVIELGFLLLRGQYLGYETPIFLIATAVLLTYSWCLTSDMQWCVWLCKKLY